MNSDHVKREILIFVLCAVIVATASAVVFGVLHLFDYRVPRENEALAAVVALIMVIAGYGTWPRNED